MSQSLEIEVFGLKYWQFAGKIQWELARSKLIFVAESTDKDAANVSTGDPKYELDAWDSSNKS